MMSVAGAKRERFDVVIVGGGVMGSAVAYFLAANADFNGTVAVVERDPGYGACATTRSWGGIRQQFSLAENIAMSLFGISFYRAAWETLAVDEERPDLAFREQGYLTLASADGVAVLERNHRLQTDMGAKVSLLDTGELAARFPWLNADGVAGGVFGFENEGWIDPHALLMAFRRKAISLGVRYRHDQVVGVRRAARLIDGVELAGGATIACGALVNAAGPWAGRLMAGIGVDLPVRPRKRMTYVFDCRTDLSAAPLVIDPSGVVFRPEGGRYLGLISPDPADDPDSDDLELEYGLFDEVVWPLLAARVPAFEAIKLAGAWAGHYDYNTFDQNAIIGHHPEIANLLFCNGFSGHGVQQSPAAGRAVAELIAYGGYREIDLARLCFERIANNDPILEDYIV